MCRFDRRDDGGVLFAKFRARARLEICFRVSSERGIHKEESFENNGIERGRWTHSKGRVPDEQTGVRMVG